MSKRIPRPVRFCNSTKLKYVCIDTPDLLEMLVCEYISEKADHMGAYIGFTAVLPPSRHQRQWQYLIYQICLYHLFHTFPYLHHTYTNICTMSTNRYLTEPTTHRLHKLCKPLTIVWLIYRPCFPLTAWNDNNYQSALSISVLHSTHTISQLRIALLRYRHLRAHVHFS